MTLSTDKDVFCFAEVWSITVDAVKVVLLKHKTPSSLSVRAMVDSSFFLSSRFSTDNLF